MASERITKIFSELYCDEPNPVVCCRNEDCMYKDRIFIGSIGSAIKREFLAKFNITSVLSVCQHTVTHDGVAVKQIDIPDNPKTVKLENHFENCFKFIEDAVSVDGNILIHCTKGISRSSSVITAFLMKSHHLSFLDALERVREGRSIVKPHIGFALQLIRFEKSLKNE